MCLLILGPSKKKDNLSVEAMDVTLRRTASQPLPWLRAGREGDAQQPFSGAVESTGRSAVSGPL